MEKKELLKYCVFSVKTFYVCGLGSRFYDQTMKAWKDTEKEVWEKGKGMKTNEADRFRETFRRHWIFELFKLQQTFFSVSWFHLLVSCERMLHSCYRYCDMNMKRFNIEWKQRYIYLPVRDRDKFVDIKGTFLWYKWSIDVLRKRYK